MADTVPGKVDIIVVPGVIVAAAVKRATTIPSAARSPWRQAAILSLGDVFQKPSEAKGCRQRYDIDVV